MAHVAIVGLTRRPWRGARRRSNRSAARPFCSGSHPGGSAQPRGHAWFCDVISDGSVYDLRSLASQDESRDSGAAVCHFHADLRCVCSVLRLDALHPLII
jgi:hypothetical protein